MDFPLNHNKQKCKMLPNDNHVKTNKGNHIHFSKCMGCQRTILANQQICCLNLVLELSQPERRPLGTSSARLHPGQGQASAALASNQKPSGSGSFFQGPVVLASGAFEGKLKGKPKPFWDFIASEHADE